MTNKKPAFTLEQVRTFVAVADLEHVTQAAERINLSQGAVTQQIKLFERALGVRLFDRVGRNVRLTDAGRRLLDPCRAGMRAMDAIQEAARASRALETGSVHVGASQTVASSYLAPRLARFLGEYPNIDVQVSVGTTDSVAAQVASGILDTGLVAGAVDRPGMTQVEVGVDEVLIVVARDHPLARVRSLTLERLRTARYLAREPRAETEALARVILGRAYDLVPRIEMGNMDAVRSGVLAGVGFGALPRIAISQELEHGSLVPLPIQSATRSIRAIRRSSLGGPASEAFWKVLTGGGTERDGAGFARRRGDRRARED